MIRVFISAPFGQSEFFGKLAEALKYEDIDVFRADDIADSGDWQGAVLSAIKRCSVFVADVEHAHPNVMFELGCAIGSGKTVLLVRSRKSELPFDLSSLPTITADPHNTRSIVEIVDWIKRESVETRVRELPTIPSAEELRSLVEDPSLLDEIEPRYFEECVTAFFDAIGISSEPVGARPGFGFDIALPGFAGHHLVIVEVKKHNRNSRISINEVQRMLGVCVAAEAQCAIIITSGGFTSSALYFAESAPLRLVLYTLDEFVESDADSITKRCTGPGSGGWSMERLFPGR